MRTELVICGKSYKPAELTFGNLRKLEKMGLNPYELGATPVSAVTAYVALTVDCRLTDADQLLDKQMDEVGNIDEISECFTEAIEESGFFQQLLGTKKKNKKK